MLIGALLALDNPTKEATNIWEPDKGIPNIVPKNKITAVGISLAKAVLGCNSVIVPTFFITPLPITTIPLAKLKPAINNIKVRFTSKPATIPTAFEQSLPARENAVQQITTNKIYEKIRSALS